MEPSTEDKAVKTELYLQAYDHIFTVTGKQSWIYLLSGSYIRTKLFDYLRGENSGCKCSSKDG